MERIITEHEVKGEYKFIRQITHKYVTVDGVEYGPNTHRAPQHVPGKLVDDAYVKTDIKTLNADVKVLAGHFWTQDVHDLYEELLKEQQVEIDSLGS